MDKLLLVPQAAGYAIQSPEEATMAKMPGGAPLIAADTEGGSSTVDCSFMLDPAGWQYFEAFYRNRADHSATPFLIDLILDGSDLAEFTAWFVPGSKKLGGVNGPNRIVEVQLEVLPADEDEDQDSIIVDLYGASDGDPLGYLDLLEQIVAAWPAA